MKFVHISDVHLGMRPDASFPWGEIRERELYDTFFRVIDYCNQDDIDLLLIAGDLCHKPPGKEQFMEISYAFSKLNKTKVVLIAGSSDYISEVSLYRNETWPNNVYPLLSEVIDYVYIEELNTYVYGSSVYSNKRSTMGSQMLMPLSKEGNHILLQYGEMNNYNTVNKEQSGISGFDYIALGNNHKPERITEKMAYSGSLEPLDSKEEGSHGFILGNISKESCYLQFVKFAKRKYDIIHVEADSTMNEKDIYDQVSSMILEKGKDSIYKVIINGSVDGNVEIDAKILLNAGNIVELLNNTTAIYDYKKLSYANKDNIIGMYIDTVRHMQIPNQEIELVMFYGVKALLNSKEN